MQLFSSVSCYIIFKVITIDMNITCSCCGFQHKFEARKSIGRHVEQSQFTKLIQCILFDCHGKFVDVLVILCLTELLYFSAQRR